jgi:methanogenic corrinoid protein MtbC1
MGVDSVARIGIGALSRAAGVPVETLRTWERRYGFPRPERMPSGHRLYSVTDVPRLRRIAEALSLGVRASQVVGATEEALNALLRASVGASFGPLPVAPGSVPETDDLLAAVRRYDALELNRAMLGAWGRLGPLEFVRACVAPLVTAVGDAWESGALEIRHEHFLSERLSDLLRTLRMPFEDRAQGPLVLLTTFPGESHVLGLQMVALLLVACGSRVLLLGAQTPQAQIAALAHDTHAHAVGISVSPVTAGPATARELTRLRRALPAHTPLLVGGAGAPDRLHGVLPLTDLGALDIWARQVARGVPARAIPIPRRGKRRGHPIRSWSSPS